MVSKFDEAFSEMAEAPLLDEMGEASTYRPAAGGTVALTAMIGTEEAIDRTEADGDRNIERIRPITISTDPAAASGGVAAPGVNDQIDVGSVTYEVRNAINKSGNLVTLECVRLGSVERARPGYRGRR